MIALVLILLLAVALPVRVLAPAYAPVSATDVDRFVTRWSLEPTPLVRRLAAAYLSRGRRYRTTISVAGWTSAIVFGLLGPAHFVGAGLGRRSPSSDLLVMGIGGYLVGALAAEFYNVRRRGNGPRVASLTVRSLDTYADPGTQRLLRTGAALPVAMAVVALATPHDRPIGAEVWVFAVLAPLVAVLVEVVQRFVVTRPRPLMDDDLCRADDAIRVNAIRSLATGGAGLVFLFTAWDLNAIASAHDAAWTLLAALFATGVYCYAVMLAIRARRFVWPRGRRLDEVAAR